MEQLAGMGMEFVMAMAEKGMDIVILLLFM